MYDYCLYACGTWVVTCDDMFLSYATSEDDARETAKEYNEEEV